MGDELRKVRFLLAAFALLGVACYFGFQELAYVIDGRDISASVTRISDVTKRGVAGEHTSRLVEFSFTEPNGTPRTGEDYISTNWTPPTNPVIQVRYTPSLGGRARLAENVNWIGLGWLAVAVCLVLFLGIRPWLLGRAATRRPNGDRPRGTWENAHDE
jgi:hypothetical protein